MLNIVLLHFEQWSVVWWEEELCAAITDSAPRPQIIFTKQLVATLFVIFLTAGPALLAASPGQGCVLDRFVLPCAGVLYVAGELRAPQPLLSTDIIFLRTASIFIVFEQGQNKFSP